jgi:hypothetical protein
MLGRMAAEGKGILPGEGPISGTMTDVAVIERLRKAIEAGELAADFARTLRVNNLLPLKCIAKL